MQDPTFQKSLLTATFEEIIGQKRAKEEFTSALLSGRNIILVGPPGVGKTTLAKSVASLLPKRIVNDCSFHCDPAHPSCPECTAPGAKPKTKTLIGENACIRVQGSPDLTAEDLLGDIDPIKALQFGPLTPQAFTPGKVFRANGGILFFDEINRCTEKLQNALLQVLEEHRVTIGSYDIEFPARFILIGTMNPQDGSTEELSDVFLDRFDLVQIGYPETSAIEEQIVNDRRQSISGVDMPQTLQKAVIAFIRQLRMDKNLEKKPSVRASIGVIDRATAMAALRGNSIVTPDDVSDVLYSVLAHRISLKPSMKYLEDPATYLRKQFATFARDHDLEGGVP